MPKFEYSIGLYITEGVVEAEDEDDAKFQAKQYASDQFHDALGQADMYVKQVADDAEAVNAD